MKPQTRTTTPAVRKKILLQVTHDQFQYKEKPLRMFLTGDIVEVEKVETIISDKIYYLINKETQEHLFFCTITEAGDRYLIKVDADTVEIMKEDFFSILDCYQYVRFERWI